jgi:hypothetical protein
LAKRFLKDVRFRSGGEISLGLFREIFAKGKTEQFPEKHAFKKRLAKTKIRIANI